MERKPNFENLKKVLEMKRPDRPVLYELFLNNELYTRFSGRTLPSGASFAEVFRWKAEAFAAAGYDYVSSHASGFGFSKHHRVQAQTLSLNDGAGITDWAAFERYQWDDPDAWDTSLFGRLDGMLPEGMKVMIMGPGGVLENVIALMGYENLCYMIYEDVALVEAICEKVGSLLLRYYEAVVGFDSVGFLCSNDDWGFNTQTFLSPADMRRFIFPWHQKIVALAHRHGKPCMLHSCGYFGDVIEDVIVDMGYDARHSYEDAILPVESAYEQLVGRIAVLGGMDMDFICRATPGEVRARCEAMLDRSQARGGYALGTGNSVPEYIPFENYQAILDAVWYYRA